MTLYIYRFYNVVGPRTIRPNSEYHCAISVQATSEPTSVTAVLQGISYNGTRLFTQEKISILPYSSKLCTLKVSIITNAKSSYYPCYTRYSSYNLTSGFHNFLCAPFGLPLSYWSHILFHFINILISNMMYNT